MVEQVEAVKYYELLQAVQLVGLVEHPVQGDEHLTQVEVDVVMA